jgi:hypothetical protein
LLALRRHWLGQSLPEDRTTLVDCLTAIGSHPHNLSSQIADPEVCALAGVRAKDQVLAIEALHGGRYPTANMAFAMALDVIDGTPGQWVSGVDEECRWVEEEDDGYEEPGSKGAEIADGYREPDDEDEDEDDDEELG